jgi:hypothetical protein
MGLSRIWSGKWIGDKMSARNNGDVDVSSDDIGERCLKCRTLSGVTEVKNSESSHMLRFQNSTSKISKSNLLSLWGVGQRVLLVDSCESLMVGSSCKDDRWYRSIGNAANLS